MRCYDTYSTLKLSVIVTLRTVTNISETWRIRTGCGSMGNFTGIKIGQRVQETKQQGDDIA